MFISLQTTITIENDKWIQMQKANDPTAVDSKVTRELTDDNTMLSVRILIYNLLPNFSA